MGKAASARTKVVKAKPVKSKADKSKAAPSRVELLVRALQLEKSTGIKGLRVLDDLTAKEFPTSNDVVRALYGLIPMRVGPAGAEIEIWAVFRFRIALRDIRPTIWREILVRADGTFNDLHEAIQAAGGWNRGHMFEFRSSTRGAVIAGVPDDDLQTDAPFAHGVRLGTYFTRGGAKQCLYNYDFGDGWEVDVKLLQVEFTDEPFRRRLLDGRRAFPPEDCGGVPGYMRYVRIVTKGVDPEGEDVKESLEWLDGWRPDVFDVGRTALIFNA